jgi:hypothetical protein
MARVRSPNCHQAKAAAQSMRTQTSNSTWCIRRANRGTRKCRSHGLTHLSLLPHGEEPYGKVVTRRHCHTAATARQRAAILGVNRLDTINELASAGTAVLHCQHRQHRTKDQRLNIQTGSKGGKPSMPKLHKQRIGVERTQKPFLCLGQWVIQHLGR